MSNFLYKKIKEFKLWGFVFSWSKPVTTEYITVQVPKALIEGLRGEFDLPENASNADVLKNAILISKHTARNGLFVIDKNKPNVPMPFGPIYGGRN